MTGNIQNHTVLKKIFGVCIKIANFNSLNQEKPLQYPRSTTFSL